MRSWLFVPANAENKIRKALSGDADAVIIDLEDSVPFDEKDAARTMAAEIAATMANGTRPAIYLRVNERASQWFTEDILAAANGPFSGIILPKSETAEDVLSAVSAMERAETNTQRSSKLDLVPLIESAVGVLNAREILSASSRVRRVTFGIVDFLLDIGGKQSKDGSETLFAMSYLALASRAAGKDAPVDTVYPDFRDAMGLEAAAVRARCLGFDGKLLIHPCQIEAANRIFSPSAEEIDFSGRVVREYSAAVAQGIAAIKVDGKMVDLPVYRHSLQILSKAEKYGLLTTEGGIL